MCVLVRHFKHVDLGTTGVGHNSQAVSRLFPKRECTYHKIFFLILRLSTHLDSSDRLHDMGLILHSIVVGTASRRTVEGTMRVLHM